MNLNPLAVVFWVFCALIGWLIADGRGALWGAVFGIGFSFLMMFVREWRGGR